MENKIRIDLKTLHPDIREWINFEIAASNAHDIAVHIFKRKRVKMDNISCRGYFCSHTERLVVAGLAENWAGITVHESCHRDQYTEQSPIWFGKIKIQGEEHDPITAFFEWLAGERELSPRKLQEVTMGALSVELDCERRAAKKIDKFYLPINTKEYIQKANAYIYLYQAIKETRQWYDVGRAPFEVPEIWTKMPTDFDNDYSRISPKLKNLILTHTFGR